MERIGAGVPGFLQQNCEALTFVRSVFWAPFIRHLTVFVPFSAGSITVPSGSPFPRDVEGIQGTGVPRAKKKSFRFIQPASARGSSSSRW